MPSSKRPSVPTDRTLPKQRKCSTCGVFGHNKRKCPTVPPAPAIPVARRQERCYSFGSPAPSVPKVVQEPSNVDWEKVLYVVFDLETTEVCKNRDEIIELTADILDKNGIRIEYASFVH